MSFAKRYRWMGTGLVSSVLLSGCASIPSSKVGPPPRAVESYASDESLAGVDTEWPADAWWETYGDPQLNTLIDEALAGSPDLRAAQARVLKASALVTQSRSALLPTINGNAGADYKRQSYNLGLP